MPVNVEIWLLLGLEAALAVLLAANAYLFWCIRKADEDAAARSGRRARADTARSGRLQERQSERAQGK